MIKLNCGIKERWEQAIEPNTWTTVKLHTDVVETLNGREWLMSSGFNELTATMVQGKNILTEVEYDGEVYFAKEFDLNMTYPISSVLFETQLERKGNLHSFRTNYGEHPRASDFIFPSFDFFQRNIPSEVTERYLRGDHIQLLNGIKLIAENLRVANKTLESIIVELNAFVSKSVGSTEREDFREKGFMNYWNLQHILADYMENGTFSGDCKCVETFTIGIANALGIPARAVRGELSVNGGVSGHFWPELYIPTGNGNGFWAPLDPANPNLETFMGFSPHSEQVKYSLTGKMPQLIGPSSTRIRISYV